MIILSFIILLCSYYQNTNLLLIYKQTHLSIISHSKHTLYLNIKYNISNNFHVTCDIFKSYSQKWVFHITWIFSVLIGHMKWIKAKHTQDTQRQILQARSQGVVEGIDRHPPQLSRSAKGPAFIILTPEVCSMQLHHIQKI